jgi:hypothetical protein
VYFFDLILNKNKTVYQLHAFSVVLFIFLDFQGEYFSEIGEKTYYFGRGMRPIFGPKNDQTSALP